MPTFSHPGLVGKIGQGLGVGFTVAEPLPAVTYLLRNTLTGIGDQALANANTITGPSGGGTVESTDSDDTGTWTVHDSSTGAVSVASNTLTIDGSLSVGNQGIIGSGVARAAGRAISTDLTSPSSGAQACYMEVNSVATPATYDAYLGINNGQNFRLDGQLVADTLAAGTATKLICLMGGFTSGVPATDGVDGALAFYYDGSDYVLIAVNDTVHAATVYPIVIANDNGALPWTLDDPLATETLFPEVFTATGYALETSVTGSTTFTHIADSFIRIKVTTLPSSGNIDIVVRDDWAVRISSAGAVTLLEDYDGSGGGPTTRATSGGTAANGSVVDIRMHDDDIDIYVDEGSRATYASATANKTDTGGSVGSLGTGGAVAHIYALPLRSATYNTHFARF